MEIVHTNHKNSQIMLDSIRGRATRPAGQFENNSKAQI